MWVVEYFTESGDQGILGAWTDEPTKQQMMAVARETHPAEFDGDNVYIYPVKWEVPLR